jgi:hypothetical protein
MEDAMTRKQLTTLISRNQREVIALTSGNDRGQNDKRIALLNENRIQAVHSLNTIKNGGK